MANVHSLVSRINTPLPRLRQAEISAPLFRLPLLLQRIPAGFPSPADEYAESALDLNTYLVRNKAATFFFRVSGDSMTGANIHDGDMLIVDRSIEPRHRHIVLAVINNEYTVKRLFNQNGVIELHAENSLYPPIRFRETEEMQVWGVVVGAVSRFVV